MSGDVVRQRQVLGREIGVFGFGHAGQEYARRISAFGPSAVRFYDPRGETLVEQSEQLPEVESVDAETLFKASDIISIHCALNASTHHFVNRGVIALMKKDAIIINCSRGAVIHQESLVDALLSGSILGAGLDVLEDEPPAAVDPVLRCPNVVLTPHVAGRTTENRFDVVDRAIENLVAFFHGGQLRPGDLVVRGRPWLTHSGDGTQLVFPQ